MVYERYIKKGGKIYGPYIQHNKKVDGKVVTEYRGKSGSSVRKLSGAKKFSQGKFFLFGLLGLILIFSLIAFANFDLTGKVSLDIKSNYVEGETLDGNLKFSLKEGELIPIDSKIVLELGGNVQEYLLSDFISLDSVDGFFYAEDTELSGEGFGYGLIGSKKIYPEVSFEMEIVDVREEEIGGTSEGEIVAPKGVPRETSEEVSTEGKEPEEVVEEIVEEPVEEVEVVISESDGSSLPESVPTETETPVEVVAPKGVSQGGTSSSSSPPANEDINAGGKEKSTEKTESKEEKKVEKVETKEEKKSLGGSESPSMTGEVILENVISGTASKDNDFEYSFVVGKTAEIVGAPRVYPETFLPETSTGGRSVNVDGKILDESVLKIKNNKDGVVVSTDYYYEEEGFGEDYVGKKELKFTINLGEFDLIAENDSLFTIKLISGETILVEANKDLSVTEHEIIESNETIIEEIINETILNETEIVSNETINFTDILLNINTTQYGAVLNKPVKWKKNVKLEKEGKVNVELPKQAENITVYKVVDEEREELEQGENNLTIEPEVVAPKGVASVDEDVNTSGKEIVEEQNETAPQTYPETFPPETSTKGKVAGNVTDEVEEIVDEIKLNVTRSLITAKVISGEISVEIGEGFSFAGLFRKIFRAMTGRVVDVEEKEEFTDVIIDDNATEYDIEYETPAPVAIETAKVYGKEIVIWSDVHYENILAYSVLPTEMPSGIVKMYWITQENVTNQTCEVVSEETCVNVTEEVCNLNEFNETVCEDVVSETCDIADTTVCKEEILGVKEVRKQVDVVGHDMNNNSLIDYVEWVVPSLSNQTYELVIVVLNVQSYPTVGGNWTVRFDTVGIADLTISAINDTSFGFGLPDDLKFLELLCGNETQNVSVIINGEGVPYDIYLKKKRIEEIVEELNG